VSNTSSAELVRQADVEFYGEMLTGALAEDGDIYIPLLQMCESLKLNVRGQQQRIQRTQALGDGLRLIVLAGQDGSRRAHLCVRVDLVPGWLAGVSTLHIGDEALRQKLVTFQRDLYKVAWAVFGPMRASVMPSGDVQAMAQRMVEISSRMEAIDQAVTMLGEHLRGVEAAVEQMRGVAIIVEGLKSELAALQTELADLQTRSKTAFKIAGDRIKGLELRLNPGDALTEEQAARVKEAVVYVANALQERGAAKAYAQVWAAFKQQFGLTEYKNLSQARFAEALEWLSRWGMAVLASPKLGPPENG
jgi:hypothetical protein